MNSGPEESALVTGTLVGLAVPDAVPAAVDFYEEKDEIVVKARVVMGMNLYDLNPAAHTNDAST